MAIVTKEKDDFIYTYSDAGFTILQTSTGNEYDNAMDLKEYPQEYTETKNKVKTEPTVEE